MGKKRRRRGDREKRRERRQRLLELLRQGGWVLDKIGWDLDDIIDLAMDLFNSRDEEQLQADLEAGLEQVSYCECDSFGFGERESKWGIRDLTYSILDQTQDGGLDNAVVFDAFEQACRSIERMCGLSFEYTTDFRAANIQINWDSNMGGRSARGGVLADSGMPYPGVTRLVQRYDRAEDYRHPPENGAGVINLLPVAKHELGHAIGFPHVAVNIPSLLNPHYNMAIQDYTSYDKQLGRKLYGDPRGSGGGGGDKMEGTFDKVVIHSDGRITIHGGEFQ